MNKYSNCTTSAEILNVQDEYLKQVQAEKLNRKNEIDFPSSSSDSSSDSDDNDDLLQSKQINIS